MITVIVSLQPQITGCVVCAHVAKKIEMIKSPCLAAGLEWGSVVEEKKFHSDEHAASLKF